MILARNACAHWLECHHSSSATVSNLSLNILGVDTLAAPAVSATATCPFAGAQTADTTVTGLQLFGSAVNLTANGPAVTQSVGVTVGGLVGGTLSVSLTRTEIVTASGAAATAVLATVTLSGTVAGLPVVIPAGSVILAEAACERPAAAAAPTAPSIVPNAGPQSGGQTVTITGTNFIDGGTTVTFNGAPATNVTVAPDGTSLTAVTPPGVAGPASVVTTTGGGSAPPLGYTYLPDGSAANVTSLSPDVGPTAGGTPVTITGSGFTGAIAVTFGGGPGTGFTVDPSGTTITVVTPPHTAGPTPVTLVFPAGSAAAGTFTYVAPTITSVAPDQGTTGGGTRVTVSGTGFVPGQTTVSICGRVISAGGVTVDPSGLSLTFVTPACQAGSATVTVTTPAGTSNGLTFRYVTAGLPVTGAPIVWYLATGLLMLGVGSVGVVLGRQ